MDTGQPSRICEFLHGSSSGSNKDKVIPNDVPDMGIATEDVFVEFLNSVLTMEEDHFETCSKILEETELKFCQDSSDTWLGMIKSQMFGQSNAEENEAKLLERSILKADIQVLRSVLKLLQHDFESYMSLVRGCWGLRTAWRLYHKDYEQLRQLYVSLTGSSPTDDSIISNTGCSDPSSIPIVVSSSPSCPSGLNGPSKGRRISRGLSLFGVSSLFGGSGSNGVKSSSSMTNGFQPDARLKSGLSEADVRRLMGAVSFGYGLFHLCLSLLPSSVHRLVNFLGFKGDRSTGVKALSFARKGTDLRAPMASVVLLWYYTVVHPYLALENFCDTNKQSIFFAEEILNEELKNHDQSPLFLFFKGKVYRMKRDVTNALSLFEQSASLAQQRELKLLSLHEVGWCHLLKQNWIEAISTFLSLHKESKWCKSFYAYLSAIGLGSISQPDQCLFLLKYTAKYFNNQTETVNPIESFVLNRVKILLDSDGNRCDLNDCSVQPGSPHSEECLNKTESEDVPALETVTLHPPCAEIGPDLARPPCSHICRMFTYELIYLWNALSACDPMQLDAIIGDCSSLLSSPSLSPIAFLIQGSCYNVLGQTDAAIQSYRDCLSKYETVPSSPKKSQSSSDDQSSRSEESVSVNGDLVHFKHIAAFASYELGVLLCRRKKNCAEGIAYLRETKSKYSGYDFESRLGLRIQSALEKYDSN